MKFVVTWKPRSGGSSAENEESLRRNLQVFSKWTPPSDITFHQFVGRLDGEGGFAVVECDNVKSLMDGPSKFSPWFEFNTIPVADIQDTVPSGQEGIDFRDSIS